MSLETKTDRYRITRFPRVVGENKNGLEAQNGLDTPVFIVYLYLIGDFNMIATRQGAQQLLQR